MYNGDCCRWPGVNESKCLSVSSVTVTADEITVAVASHKHKHTHRGAASTAESVKENCDQCGNNRPQPQWGLFWLHLVKSSVTPTNMSFPIITNAALSFHGTFGDLQKIRKWNLVDSCSYVVWQAKPCMFSPPDWSRGRLSLLRNRPLNHPLGEELCHFLKCHRRIQCTLWNALYWELFDRLSFSSPPQPSNHNCSSLLFHFFSLHLADNKQRHVFGGWKQSVFHLLSHANAQSPPAYA